MGYLANIVHVVWYHYGIISHKHQLASVTNINVRFKAGRDDALARVHTELKYRLFLSMPGPFPGGLLQDGIDVGVLLLALLVCERSTSHWDLRRTVNHFERKSSLPIM